MQMKRCFSFIIFILIIVSVSFYGCALKKDSQKTLLLKVVLEYNDLGPLDGGKVYYNVYSSGKYEKTQEFEVSNDVESYSFDEAQTEYDKNGNLTGIDLPPYALEIIEASEEIGNNYITQLYVVENKYYFAIADTRTIKNKYSSALYEFFPDTGKYKLIAGFEQGYIKHISK